MNKIEEINHDENAYDLECLPGDQVEDRFKLINHICKFIVACLNSRFSQQTGVLISGVTATTSLEKPFLYKGLKFVPDSSIADGFMKRMGQTIFNRSTSDGSVKVIQPQHLRHMVKLEFMSATTSTASAGKRSPGEEYFALLTVIPNLKICANSIFFFSSVIDKNNLPRGSEVYKRLEGSSVLVQPNRVPRLEAELKEKYTKYSATL